MKKIFYIASIIVAAALAFSCEKAPQGGDDITSASFTFSVKVSEIGADYAKINVKHDGPEDATWYGFIAEDKKSTNDLIMEKYTEFVTSGTVKGLRTSKNRTVTVDGLESATKYKYIVFAITEDAKLYTNVESKAVTFTTGVNPYVLTQTDEWTITRRTERENNMEMINVDSTNESPLYVWDYVSKEWVDNFNTTYPDGFDVMEEEGGPVLATLDAFQLYIIQQIATIQYYVASGDYAVTDLTYAYDTADPNKNTFMIPRVSSGDYYFVAFGFNHDGSHTQTYSVSDVISIAEEASTPEYEAWLGNYTFSGKGLWVFNDDEETGRKKGDEKDITYNITIEHLDNNFMYLIKGWECGEGADVDIETEFFELDKEAGDYLGFIGYYNDGKLEIRETNITSDGTYAFGMMGWAANEKDEMAPVMFDNTAMAIADPIAAGSNATTLNGLNLYYNKTTGQYNNTDGELVLTYNMMGYIYYEYATYTPVAIANMPVQFPITIAKSDKGYKTMSNPAAKQEVLKKMKSARPMTIKADKKNKPVKRGRR